jgi:peptidoglycan/LPS O-acetylase OafA/YrhL
MKIKYRPEIDGLRAIAIVSVILYHAQITILGYQPFKGGFIGVDIFFVISGYLITSIILNELVITGSFSFKYFYERRIRRILPALFFVILVSLPFAWLYLLPSSLIDFSKSILYSLGLSSNFYFHYSGQGYGAEDTLFKPFLHTWSLSVEEQYYILFPIILLIVFKHFRKYLIHILIFGFVTSLGLADWSSRNFPSLTFYVLPTRAWEFLAGSILAYFEITKGNRCTYNKLNLILPTIGLLLIAHSIFFFRIPFLEYYLQTHNYKVFHHPSFYTLSPIIGVCLIIWFSNKDEITTKILSSKLFVGIGLISYSLYLWHYPIFAFARINQFIEGDNINRIIIALVTLCSSIFSYYFIEKFFRNRKNNFRKILIFIVTFVLIIVIFIVFSLFKNGKINENNYLIEATFSSPLYRAECKFSSAKSDFLNEYFFNEEFLNCKKKYKKFILILGDSHSVDLFNSISKISKKNEFIIGLNKGGCIPYGKNANDCHYDNALKFIQRYSKDIKYIFFSHKGSYLLTQVGTDKHFAAIDNRKLILNGQQINSTIKYLKLIKKMNNNLIFIGPHMEPNITINKDLIINVIKKNYTLKDKSNYDLIILDNELKKKSHKNQIRYISKIDTIKFKFEKDFIIDGNFTYSDIHHWSEFGEIYFGKKLVFNSIIKEILFP